MSKAIIVVNGSGGVGKDTLCNFVAEEYQTHNVSSIDPIKEIARQVGWKDKDLKGRAFLSSLKLLCSEYNDFPFTYLIDKTREFLDSEAEVMFVHIREPQEIEKYCEGVYTTLGIKPFTLLVQRDTGIESYGNMADDNVRNYDYDIYFNNNQSLSDSRVDILHVVDRLIKEEM